MSQKPPPIFQKKIKPQPQNSRYYFHWILGKISRYLGSPPSAIRNVLPEHPEDLKLGMKKPRRCQGVSLRWSFEFSRKQNLWSTSQASASTGNTWLMVWKIFQGLYGWIDGMSDRPAIFQNWVVVTHYINHATTGFWSLLTWLYVSMFPTKKLDINVMNLVYSPTTLSQDAIVCGK